MPRKTALKIAIPAGDLSVSGSGQETPVGEYAEAIILVDVTALSGSGGPSLTLVPMVGDPGLEGGSAWRLLASALNWVKASDGSTVTAIVATGKYSTRLAAPIGSVLRLDYVLAGTLPVFTAVAYWQLKD